MGEENHDLWRVFFTNSAKTPLYLHSMEWSALHLLLSQPVGCGLEPGLVLGIVSCFPASRSWVRSSPSPYFFCNKSVAENIPVLSGRLVILCFIFAVFSLFYSFFEHKLFPRYWSSTSNISIFKSYRIFWDSVFWWFDFAWIFLSSWDLGKNLTMGF